MLESIDHVNLVVENLDLMADFYTRLLGMTITQRVTISGQWIDQTVGLENVLADVIYLDPPSGPRVELIRYRNPAPSPPGRPNALGNSNTPGLRHLAFRVRGIEEMVARLRDAGVQFLSDVQRVPTGQVKYAGGVQKSLVYFNDPEGNLLELCEYRNP